MDHLYDFAELQSFIEINSYTRNKAGVDKVIERFSPLMQEIGFEVDIHKREHIGNHVHYRSAKKEGERILILGHFDTVFPEGTFTDFTQDDDWIYGPGVCDMKGGNHIALEALRNVYKQHGEIYNIDMLMVSDEETGSDDSKALTTSLVKDYDFCMVFEAAGPQQDVVIARKGIATYYIDIEGKGAHAGNHFEDGTDANIAAAQTLLALSALSNVSLGTTVNVGKISGGIGANTISPSAKLVVEARFTKSDERDRVLSAFNKLNDSVADNGAAIRVAGGLQRDVMQPSEKQTQYIKRIENILGKPLITEKRGGVSDANVVSAAGVASLDGFGPFGDGDHTVHERANKASYVERIEDVTKIFSQLIYK